MKNVGFIGWRGMVGSVLMQRMVEERFRRHRLSSSPLPSFQAAPSGGTTGTLQDAYDLAPAALDIIVTRRMAIIPTKSTEAAKAAGSYWIDAALRFA
ncbi:MAG: hypothetical protein ACLR9W_07525 [Enterobacter hormaechei]